MKNLVLFFSALLLFFSCKEIPKKSSVESTPSVSEAPKSAGSFYKHFKGTVDTLPVTLDLVRVKTNNIMDEGFTYRGHYYYDKFQQPIAIYGETDSAGNVVLHETNINQNEIYFKGKIDVNNNFTGTWQDESRKKTLPFSLKETYADGSLAFEVAELTDSIKLWDNNPKSPKATFSTFTFMPSKTAKMDASLAAFLKDKILMGVKNDTVDKSYANTTIEKEHAALRDTFFKFYRETLSEEKPEPSGEGAAMLNYDEASYMNIVFNENNLLSLGFSTYAYTGGAHGNYATAIATYDLAQKKKLTISDIFKPNYEKPLSKILGNAARRQFGLKPNASLSPLLFENKVEPNTNFCLTKKGITFLYNPYEIAAYAMGELEIFVPFSEIKTLLNPPFGQ